MELSKVLKNVRVACDKCDWETPIEPEEMENYLDAVCPVCDEVLITQEELDIFTAQCEFIKGIPEELGEMFESIDSQETVSVRVVAGRD